METSASAMQNSRYKLQLWTSVISCHILSLILTTFTSLAVKFLITVIRLTCKWSEHEWAFFSEYVLVLCYAPVLTHRCAKAVLCYYFRLKSMLMFVWSQTYVAELEQQLADCESALVEEKVAAQERKHQTEQHQYQVDICSLILLFTFSFDLFLEIQPGKKKNCGFPLQMVWHINCCDVCERKCKAFWGVYDYVNLNLWSEMWGNKYLTSGQGTESTCALFQGIF